MNRTLYPTIIKEHDPILREKAVTVRIPLTVANERLARQMLRYVLDSRDEIKAERYALKAAVGLAAPQVGKSVQIIVVSIDDEDTYVLANPKIISHSVKQAVLANGEGCLSVEDPHPGYVRRASRITVQAYDVLNKQMITLKARDYLAIVLQHEIDHLRGVMFYDTINEDDPWAIDEEIEIIE